MFKDNAFCLFQPDLHTHLFDIEISDPFKVPRSEKNKTGHMDSNWELPIEMFGTVLSAKGHGGPEGVRCS